MSMVKRRLLSVISLVFAVVAVFVAAPASMAQAQPTLGDVANNIVTTTGGVLNTGINTAGKVATTPGAVSSIGYAIHGGYPPQQLPACLPYYKYPNYVNFIPGYGYCL